VWREVPLVPGGLFFYFFVIGRIEKYYYVENIFSDTNNCFIAIKVGQVVMASFYFP